MSNTHPLQRPYSKRHAAGAVRKSVIAFRVTEHSQLYIETLANEFSMSISEYIARLVSDHIAKDQFKRKTNMQTLERNQ